MQSIESQIDINSDAFKSNSEYMSSLFQKVKDALQKQADKENAYQPKADKKGKLLPRKRLSLLLDPGTPFLELWSLGGFQMLGDKDGSTCGGNIITGIGQVCGRKCLIVVWNFAIKGGTMNAITGKKMLALQKVAFKTGLPIISLSESGGGDLSGDNDNDPWAALNFLEGGMSFCQQAELSAAGIPQITVAHGNATAGGAYQVALSDFIVLVRNQTQLFLAGPPLLKAATGEVADAETLGGAEMHATVSGTGEYLAEDDEHGIRIARDITSTLAKDLPSERSKDFDPPLYSPDELLGIVPEDKRSPYDVREVIARIADGSRFFEFSPDLDNYTICGHMDIEGITCGVIGNNGPITPNGSMKAAHFIQLCDQSNRPVVFLQNTTGFLVGVDVERGGQVKHGAKLLQAVANMRAPKITIILGNSYGAGNYAMASHALKPDFLFSWPTARQAVMGGAQAAKVIEIVAEGKLVALGQGAALMRKEVA